MRIVLTSMYVSNVHDAADALARKWRATTGSATSSVDVFAAESRTPRLVTDRTRQA
jgi:hypothetical protein